MVEQAVEDRGGQCRIVVEDLGPVLEHAIGGDCDGAVFVSLADDLEQQVGALSIPSFNSLLSQQRYRRPL